MSAIAAVQPLLADTGWDHMNGGSWFLMGIGMLVFWGLVIFGIVWLVRTLTTDHRSTHAAHAAEPSAAEVLDRKLAEGAISVDDYRERRQLLVGEPKQE
jgi:putative membrane protein